MKRKTVTVNRLAKDLKTLIEMGKGRLPVCINKDTFSHNCESDGVAILPVDGCAVKLVGIADDDGGTKVNKDGSESYRSMAVLHGESGEGFKSLLSRDSVEAYIRQLHWSEHATENEKTIAIGNIRGFAEYLRRTGA